MAGGIAMGLVLLQVLLLMVKSWSLAFSPEKQWRRVQDRRRRRDPDVYHDDEPGDAALNRYRITGFVALLILGTVAYGTSREMVRWGVGGSSARRAAVAAVADLRSEHPVETPSASHVRHVVHDYNPFARFRDTGSGRYQISNAVGRGTVCLTISYVAGRGYTGGGDLDSDITDGRC